MLPKLKVKIPKIMKVGNLEAKVVCFSEKCILFKRASPSGVTLSYDLFKIDGDTVNEYGSLIYPSIDMFSGVFHTATRYYSVSGYRDRNNEELAVAEHRVFLKAMRLFEDYTK